MNPVLKICVIKVTRYSNDKSNGLVMLAFNKHQEGACMVSSRIMRLRYSGTTGVKMLNIARWPSNLVRSTTGAKFRMMTFINFICQQRSIVVNCIFCRPYFGQKSGKCKLRMMMMTFMKVENRRRSNMVIHVLWIFFSAVFLIKFRT